MILFLASWNGSASRPCRNGRRTAISPRRTWRRTCVTRRLLPRRVSHLPPPASHLPPPYESCPRGCGRSRRRTQISSSRCCPVPAIDTACRRSFGSGRTALRNRTRTRRFRWESSMARAAAASRRSSAGIVPHLGSHIVPIYVESLCKRYGSSTAQVAARKSLPGHSRQDRLAAALRRSAQTSVDTGRQEVARRSGPVRAMVAHAPERI